MSIYDKSIKNVAEAAAKIMGEALKGNQHKIDANKNNKIDSQDFKLLRAGKKPEQVKESGEMGPVKNTMGSVMMRHKTSGKEINIINTPEAIKQHQARGYEKLSTVKKEEVELQEMSDMIDALIQEYESKGGTYRHKGTYGYGGKGAEHGETDYKKENDLSKATEKPAKKKYGSRQNYVRSTRVNESFSELLQKYTEGGVKSLNESMYVLQEEADNEQFTKELEKSKRKDSGQDRNDANIASGSIQSVNIAKAVNKLTSEATDIKSIVKKSLTKIHGPGEITFKKTSNGGHMVHHENDFGDLHQHQYDPKTGKVEPAHGVSYNEEIEHVDEAMSHQAKTTMKHVKNPTAGEKAAAKDIKPGVSGYRDRVAMLQSAKARGALKEDEALDEEGPQGKVPMTSLMPGHSDKAARFAAVQAKGKLVKGKAQSAPQKEPGMKKEEVEQVDERSMTEPEMKERERIVKGMKKGLSGFKQRYGERAKSVLYATASKIAKEKA